MKIEIDLSEYTYRPGAEGDFISLSHIDTGLTVELMGEDARKCHEYFNDSNKKKVDLFYQMKHKLESTSFDITQFMDELKQELIKIDGI